ncbi:MAG: TIR domain-containing protein [Calditrichaeota bacterium]|nr:MAG: TIR domain-containing protein [Calditrichota bacterium]
MSNLNLGKVISFVAKGLLAFGALHYIFGEKKPKDTRKRIFISFAIEDEFFRDRLMDQARKENSPFDFIDMSAKKPWKQDEWKKRCRTKIKKCDGVIALISKKTHEAGGARWEMKCALEEKIPTIGMQIQWNDKGAKPKELKNKKVIRWTWNNISEFLNTLN